MANVGIKNSWSFISFVKTFGPTVKIAPFINSKTNEPFTSLAVIDNSDTITLVSFSSSLGELNKQQLKAQKNKLQVVELETGKYKLCKQGTDNWETVDLGI